MSLNAKLPNCKPKPKIIKINKRPNRQSQMSKNLKKFKTIINQMMQNKTYDC